jgi:ribosomal protein L40E
MPDPVTVAVIVTGAPTIDAEGLTWSAVVVSKAPAKAFGVSAATAAAATTRSIARRISRRCGARADPAVRRCFLSRCLSFIGVRSTACPGQTPPQGP